MSEPYKPPQTRAERRAAAREAAKLLVRQAQQTGFRWSGTITCTCLGLAMTLGPFLTPPATPLWTGIALVVLFALLTYPMLHLAQWRLLPGPPWLKHVIVIVILVAFVFSIGEHAWPRMTITPSGINFAGQYMAYIFTVRNDTQRDVNEVVVKFSYGVTPDNFKIEPAPPKILGTDKMVGDTFGLSCHTSHGSYNSYYSIYRLTPGESRDFTVTLVGTNPAKMQTRIAYFTTTPLPHLNQPGKIGVPIQFDEDCMN